MAVMTGQFILLTLHFTDYRRVLLCINQISWLLSSSFHSSPSSIFNSTPYPYELETRKRFSARSKLLSLLCCFFYFTWNTRRSSRHSRKKTQSTWILLFKKQVWQFLHHNKVHSPRHGLLYSSIITTGRCFFQLASRFCQRNSQKSKQILQFILL